MKIFLDTADLKVVKYHLETGLIDGVTTNPSLILKSGAQLTDRIKELADIGVPDISAEVVGETSEEMLSMAESLYSISPQVTIKVPCTKEGLKACKFLSDRGIRVNVTLIFSVSQAILATNAGATYVSPFIGRLDDQRLGGVDLVKKIASVYREHLARTQVLAASTRSVYDVEKAFEVGADVVTMPPSIFEKMYDHDLTEKGIQIFNSDWKAAIAATTDQPE
jgi:transaldolase